MTKHLMSLMWLERTRSDMIRVGHYGVLEEAHPVEELLLEAGGLLPLGLVQAGGQGAQVKAQGSDLPAQLLARLSPAIVHDKISPCCPRFAACENL